MHPVSKAATAPTLNLPLVKDFKTESAKNFVSRNSARKKLGQPDLSRKKCVSRSLAIKNSALWSRWRRSKIECAVKKSSKY